MIEENKVLYIYVSMLVLLFWYLIYALGKYIAFKKKVNKKIKNNAKLKNLPVFLETCFKNITRSMTGENMEVVKAHMQSMGIDPKRLTRNKTKAFLNSFVQKYANKTSRADITEKYGSGIIDFMYRTLQIKLEAGSEYSKLQKKINSKMSRISTKEIKNYMVENYKGEITDDLVKSIKKNMTSSATADISNNLQMEMQSAMQRQMQNDMQFQLQNDMHQQMMMDMQNQMQLQMQLDLQNQMQLQMQMDMQQQMQNQMMMDMQQQMTMDLQNTMHQSQMAITPMHDGGHMMDMNNMHMGGL